MSLLKDKHNMDIVVDFDGTVCAFDFPRIGPNIGAEEVLKELIAKGHKLILFTMRDGEHLAQAIQWFIDRNIQLYGIQTNPTQRQWTTSNKAHGDMYIDDLALGIPLTMNTDLSARPFVDWVKVREILVGRGIL